MAETVISLTNRIKVLEASLAELETKAKAAGEGVGKLFTLYEYYTKPYRCDCGRLMTYKPLMKNFWCARCDKEMGLSCRN